MNSADVSHAVDELRRRLALNIKRLRATRRLAQERLALEAGVDRTMLSKIERRVTNPSLETLLKISSRLGVDVVDLLAPASAGASAPASVPAAPAAVPDGRLAAAARLDGAAQDLQHLK